MSSHHGPLPCMSAQDYSHQLAVSKADLAAAERRAAGAEADLARVRSEAIKMQQDSRAHRWVRVRTFDDRIEGWNEVMSWMTAFQLI